MMEEIKNLVKERKDKVNEISQNVRLMGTFGGENIQRMNSRAPSSEKLKFQKEQKEN